MLPSATVTDSADVQTTTAFMSCVCISSSTGLQHLTVQTRMVFLDFIGNHCTRTGKPLTEPQGTPWLLTRAGGELAHDDESRQLRDESVNRQEKTNQ